MAKFAELTVQLELQQAAFQKGMDQAARSLAKVQAQSKQSQTALAGMEQSFARLANAAKASAAAFGTFKGLTGIAKASDDLKSLAGSFTALLGSSERSADMMERVFAIVDLTGAPLKDAAAGVQRMTIALGEMGANNQQIATISENFLKLARIGGSSAQEAAAAFQQFGQALGAGKLAGDELRSVLEGAPLVAREIAKEFGVSTGELKKLGEAGELNTARVANAMLKATARINAAFAELPQTFEQSMNRASASLTQFLAEFDNASRTSTNLQISLDYIAGILKRWTDELKDSNTEFSLVKLAADAVRIAFETIAVLVANVAFVAEGLARSFAAAAVEAYRLATLDFSALGDAWKASEEQAARARAQLDAFEEKLLRIKNTAGEMYGPPAPPVLITGQRITGGAGAGGGSKEAEALAKALKAQGDALAASLDPLTAYNQKMIELNKLLAAGAIGSVTYSKAMAKYKEELTAVGDALTASVNPQFNYEMQMKKINQAFLDQQISIETLIELEKKLAKERDQAKGEKHPIVKLSEDLARAVGQGFGQFFEDILIGSLTAEQAFSKMVKSMIADIARLLAEFAALAAAQYIIKSIFGSAGGGASNQAGGKSAGTASVAVPAFNAARSLGLSATPMAGATGHSLTVGTMSASGGTGPWNVVINNNAPVDVTTRGRPDGGLEVTIERIKASLASDVARGGNPFSRSLEAAYALGRGR